MVKIKKKNKVGSLLCSRSMTYMSSQCVCGHSADLCCSTKVSVLPDNLPSTEAPLSPSETKTLHLTSSLKSLLLRHRAVYQNWDGGQQEIILQLTPPKPEKSDFQQWLQQMEVWEGRQKNSKTRQQQQRRGRGPLWTPN